MESYLTGFVVYTCAVLGLIFIGFAVAKKLSNSSAFGSKKNNYLILENSLPIGPRKDLFVVKAGGQRFLIASDSERTTFLTRLDGKGQIDLEELSQRKNMSINNQTQKKPVKKSGQQPVRQPVRAGKSAVKEISNLEQQISAEKKAAMMRNLLQKL